MKRKQTFTPGPFPSKREGEKKGKEKQWSLPSVINPVKFAALVSLFLTKISTKKVLLKPFFE